MKWETFEEENTVLVTMETSEYVIDAVMNGRVTAVFQEKSGTKMTQQ